MAELCGKRDVYDRFFRGHRVRWSHNKITAPAVRQHRSSGALPSLSVQGVVMTDTQSSQPIRVGAYLTPEFLAQAMGLPVEHVQTKLDENKKQGGTNE